MVVLSSTAIENTVMSFTIGQFLFVCSAVVLISSVVGIVIKIITWLMKPNKMQDKIISEIQLHQKVQDERMDKFETYFKRDNDAIMSIRKGNAVVQQGILALMNHAINGNDIDKLEESRDRLQEYLIER